MANSKASHGYCKLAVLWLRLLCDAGCRPERPRRGRSGQPHGAYPGGVRGVGIRDPSLIPSLEEGQQHPSCESVTLLWIHASKCWPPSGPIR